MAADSGHALPAYIEYSPSTALLVCFLITQIESTDAHWSLPLQLKGDVLAMSWHLRLSHQLLIEALIIITN
jgi:hypothetical protein